MMVMVLKPVKLSRVLAQDDEHRMQPAKCTRMFS